MIKVVTLAKAAKRSLKKAPVHVAGKLLGWVDLVENEGLGTARRIPGYRDKPLQGKRLGQRSIRLSRGWRAIYVMVRSDATSEQTIEVKEVSKHDY